MNEAIQMFVNVEAIDLLDNFECFVVSCLEDAKKDYGTRLFFTVPCMDACNVVRSVALAALHDIHASLRLSYGRFLATVARQKSLRSRRSSQDRSIVL